jgi:hypothetical protein
MVTGPSLTSSTPIFAPNTPRSTCQMKPLIPYMRQSRRKERTISIEEQRREIVRWAAENKVPLADEVVDQGVSGSNQWRERALGQAVDACGRGEAAGVIVAWQVRGAVAKPLGDGWVYSRSKSRSDVAPLMAAAVALHVADAELKPAETAALHIH